MYAIAMDSVNAFGDTKDLYAAMLGGKSAVHQINHEDFFFEKKSVYGTEEKGNF